MRLFIFSRRFLIPFFITLIICLAYFEYEFWILYKYDFNGKGLPLSVKLEWLIRQAGGDIFTVSFLLALLTGATYYGHQFLKRNENHHKLFFTSNLITILVISLLGFYFVSYVQPNNEIKSRMLLVDLIYTGPGRPFHRTTEFEYKKNLRSMTLPELFQARDSIAKKEIPETVYFTPANNDKKIQLAKCEIEIMRKITFPFTVILFFLAGILIGISFRKTVALVPLLICCLLVFPGWYYARSALERMFLQQKLGVAVAFWGIPIVLSISAMILFVLLRKYGFYKIRQEDVSFDFADET